MTIIKINSDEARGISGCTNWQRVRKMTEEEIVISALLDRDTRLLDSFDFARLHRYQDEFPEADPR